MNWFPLESLVAQGGRKIGLGGVSNVMSKLDDPLQLNKTGYFATPFTSMQKQAGEAEQNAQQASVDKLTAWNKAFGNNY